MSFTEELLMNIVIRVGAVLLVSGVIFLFRLLVLSLKRGRRGGGKQSTQQVSAPPVPPPPPVMPVDPDATVLENAPAGPRDTVFQPVPEKQPEPEYQPLPLYQPEPEYQPQPRYQPSNRPDSHNGTVPLAVQPERFGTEPWGAPQQSPKRYSLLALSGSLKGRSYPLTGGEILIGRSGACQIRFPASTAGVSGIHCKVTLAPNGTVTVTDVGSTYGTFLGDGQRLPHQRPIPLAPGRTFLLAGLDGPAFLLETQ